MNSDSPMVHLTFSINELLGTFFMSLGARNSSVMSNFCLDLSHVYTFHYCGCCTESSIKLGEILQKQKQK